MNSSINIKKIKKSFENLKVIDNVSFDVANGEFVSIIGPSGCGKTTLLHLIQGFIPQDSGSVITNGKKGFVFQDHNLLPWKTIKSNVIMGPINQGKDKKSAAKITSNILKEFELSEFENHYPHQISEGMKQRVGIARALANNPEILLMDEPFGSLDYLTKQKMQDFILNLHKKKELTTLLVTHDIDEAIKLSDRIIVLSKRPAKILDIIKTKEEKSNIRDRILKLIV